MRERERGGCFNKKGLLQFPKCSRGGVGWVKFEIKERVGRRGKKNKQNPRRVFPIAGPRQGSFSAGVPALPYLLTAKMCVFKS